MYVYVLFATVHCTMIKHNLGTYLERIYVLRDTELDSDWVFKLNQREILDKTFSPWSYLPCGKDFKPHF